MRLRVIFVVCALVGITSLNQLRAQFIDGQCILGSGFSYSFLNSKQFQSVGRPGFNCTFGFKYDISDKFGMLAYFDYSNMGAKIDAYQYDFDEQTFAPAQVKFYYSYFMVHYLATYRIKEPLSVQMGGCFGFPWLFGRALKSDNLFISEADFSRNIDLNAVKDDLSEDYGLVSGISAGNEDVQFSINYIYFFKNIFAGYGVPVKARSSVIELKVLIISDLFY